MHAQKDRSHKDKQPNYRNYDFQCSIRPISRTVTSYVRACRNCKKITELTEQRWPLKLARRKAAASRRQPRGDLLTNRRLASWQLQDC